jgi:hypothetical protein
VLNRQFAKSPIGVILVFIYLLGIYTDVILYLTPTLFIPTVVAGFAGVLLLIKNRKRVRKSHLRPIFGLLFIALLTLFFAPNRGAYFTERLKGFISLSYALINAYALFLEMSRWDREVVGRIFGIFSVLIIVGCFFENYTDFKDVSNAFRSAVFRYGVYDNPYRDYAQFGMIRPKLFTSEPSYVALFFLFSATIWLALTQRRKKYLKFIAMTMCGFFLIRSPTVLLAVPSALLIFVYLEYGGVRNLLRSARIEGRFKLSILGISLGIGLIIAFQTILAPRIRVIMTGRDISFIGRILAPPVVTYYTLKKSPFWGAGVAGKEAIESEIMTTYMNFGMIHAISRWQTNTLINQMANIFWLHWIYFGLIGGNLAAYMIGRLMKNLGVKHYILCITWVLIFTQTMGAYVGTQIWTFAFTVFLVSILHARALANTPQSPRQLHQKQNGYLPSTA